MLSKPFGLRKRRAREMMSCSPSAPRHETPMHAAPTSIPPSLPLNLHEYEAAAYGRLPRMVFDYYAGGANDETLLRETRAAWEAIRLRYHVMRDCSTCSLNTEVLGTTLDWPVLVAPMALQRMAHPEGELATVRGANRTGTSMIVSTLSTTDIETLAGASEQPLWFQLYIERDRGASKALVERAERAGCTALVLTVDSPVLGRRERDVRNGFHLPDGLTTPHVRIASRSTLAEHEVMTSALASHVAAHWDNSISCRDMEWLQSITQLPILVKGIVRGDDAVLALEHGAAGVIVSNHGGRQLDAAVTTARALPEIVDAMGGRGALLVDGGILR